MGKNLLIRGFDDETYSQISIAAKKHGVTVTSFIKNLVDHQLKDEIPSPKKHDLLLYGEDKSMEFLLKSLDRLTKNSNFFKTFCASESSNISKTLTNLKWFDSTILPYEQDTKKIEKYLKKVVDKVAINSKNQLVCFIDCVLGDVAQISVKKAIVLEKEYNKGRLQGLTFCTCRIDVLINSGLEGMLDVFACHDQIFVLKGEQIFKLHMTQENTQKLLLE